MQISTLLMFSGAAEKAMRLYVSLFAQSKMISIEHYGPGAVGSEGSVKQAIFELHGARYMCIDSPVRHEFTFTPAVSIFVDCDTQNQFEHAFETLSANGQVFMPPASYGFSERFAWAQDSFGVSWQLNLP